MSDTDSIGSVLEAYRDAVHAKDVDAFVAIFGDDVRVFDMWGTWSHVEGRSRSSAERHYRRRLRREATACFARRGPCFRACDTTHLRCRFGSRRHRSHSVSAVPTGPRRRVSLTRAMCRPFCLARAVFTKRKIV